MTRETKVGLLVGMGVILLIGIIISDHLSVVQRQNPAEQMTQFADRAQQSIASIQPQFTPEPAPEPVAAQTTARGSVMQRMQTVPTPREMSAGSWQPQPTEAAAATDSQTRELPRAYQLAADQGHLAEAAAHAAQLVEQEAQQASLTQVAASPVPSLTLSHLPTPDAVSPPMLPDDVTRPYRGTGTESSSAPRETPAPIRVINPEPVVTSGSDMIHYVQPGETLYQIAQKYYGNGEYWRTIAEHNRERVDSNGQVKQNVRLVIPNRAGLAALGDDFTPVRREIPRRVTPAARPEPPKTIEVEAGDTLTKLASEHLGSANRWKELYEANRKTLDRPESLRAGMTLVLPGQEPETPQASGSALRLLTPPSAAASQAPSSKPDTPREYVVQPGDSLSSIASKTLGTGNRWREVYEANRDKLSNPNAVVVGQTLKIPQGD